MNSKYLKTLNNDGVLNIINDEIRIKAILTYKKVYLNIDNIDLRIPHIIPGEVEFNDNEYNHFKDHNSLL